MPSGLTMQVLHWNQRVLLTRYIKPEFPDGIYKYNLNDSEVFLKHLYPQGVRIIGGWLGSVDPPISQTIAFAVVDTQRYAAASTCPAGCCLESPASMLTHSACTSCNALPFYLSLSSTCVIGVCHQPHAFSKVFTVPKCILFCSISFLLISCTA